MKTIRFNRLILGCTTLFATALVAGASTIVVPTNAVWKYLADGTDQGTAWRGLDFNDSSWLSGPAQLGFGDGDEATIVPQGEGTRFTTTYFRRTIVLSAGVTGATLRLLRDDGAVVYINGVEVRRDNMPAGAVTYSTLAVTSVGGADESTFFESTVPASVFVAGTNIIAVEVHQNSALSSDLSFALGLSVTQEASWPVVNVTATDREAREIPPWLDIPENPGVFQFSRTGSTNAALVVAVQWSGTADNGVDYHFLSNSVTIPAGSSTVNVFVHAIDDALVEGTETVVATVIPIPCMECYQPGTNATATVYIVDNEPTNSPPTLSIVSPQDGATFIAPADIAVVANAQDADGFDTIQMVEFFANGSSLGIRTNYPTANPLGPFVFSWVNVGEGTYALNAVATDNVGARGTSAPVRIFVTVSNPPPVTNIVLVATGSVWKYMDQCVDLGTAWRAYSYNDAAWGSGAAQLGYGDGDEATVINPGPDATARCPAAYFRRGFMVSDAQKLSRVTGRLLEDDGAVVYVNGFEVFRSNMPDGTISLNTLAVSTTENQVVEFTVPPKFLVTGRNTVAVEVHQVNVTSSDLSFDLELRADAGATSGPPHIVIVTPLEGDTFSLPTNIFLGANASAETLPQRIDFYSDNVFIGQAIGPLPSPIAAWGLSWSNPPVGTHALTAVITDDAGGKGTSAPVHVTITGSSTSNTPPTITFWAPADGTTYASPTNIELRASAQDVQDGYQLTVDFFAGDHLIGRGVFEPTRCADPVCPYFGLTWSNVSAGSYTLTARATDSAGAFTASTPVHITVQTSAVERTIITIVALDPSASESGMRSSIDDGTFAVRRSGNLNAAIPVLYSISGTASNGVDYSFISNSVVVPAGSTQALVRVLPLNDGLVESTESVVLTLISPVCAAIWPPAPECYVVGTPNRATVVIADASAITNPPVHLLNVNFGDGTTKTGFAAVGIRTNDFWNRYVQPWIASATLSNLIWADGTTSVVSLRVENAGGQWNNLTGDAMYDSYIYPNNGGGDGVGNVSVSLAGIPPAIYDVYLYGKADPTGQSGDGVRPESDSIFTAHIGSRQYGPRGTLQSAGWTISQPWRENYEYIRLEQVTIETGQTLSISVAPGFNGQPASGTEHPAAINGLQLVERAKLPTNGLPYVQLNEPQNGAIFAAHTNIQFRAYAYDPEDGSDINVEFFAGTNRLGRGVFVPTMCPSPYCPFFAFTWSNVPPGSFSVRAKATDHAGAATFSAPAQISVQAGPTNDSTSELHVVSVYSGNYQGGPSPDGQQGVAGVTVNRPGHRVVLALSAYEPVFWRLQVASNTVIERVILAGYYRQRVDGIGADVPVTVKFFDEGGTNGVSDYFMLGRSLDSVDFLRGRQKLCDLTGLDLSSFQGMYTAPASYLVVDQVQTDERLRCDYPQPVDLSTVPAVSFEMSFYNPGSSSNVYTRHYTMAGPAAGGRLLPGMRVVADAGGRYYYGEQSQAAWRIDSQTGTIEQMDLGLDVPELSWPVGIGFDGQRNRVLLASLGGEGFLYSYSPASAGWSVINSLEQQDFNGIVYHAPNDSIYAVHNTYEDYGPRAIFRYNANGQYQDRISLPSMPFDFGPSGYASELVSAGDFLVLLVEPSYRSFYANTEAESRIYLIDPRTSQVWLTFRHSLSLDTDGDGIPDDRDQCPGTAPGSVVNSQGCSIAQICPCDGHWTNHMQYVQCVSATSEQFVSLGLITSAQRESVVSNADHSTCGRQDPQITLAPQPTAQLLTEGCVVLVNSTEATRWILEWSTNLLDWVPFQTNTVSGTEVRISDPDARTAPSRFYRVRAE